jgi:hypothetical protein
MYPDFYEDEDVKNIDLELNTLKDNLYNIKQIFESDDFCVEGLYLPYASGLQNSTDEYYKNIAIMLLSSFFNIKSFERSFNQLELDKLDSISEPDLKILSDEVDYFFDDHQSLKSALSAMKGFCIVDDIVLAKIPNIVPAISATETSLDISFSYVQDDDFEFKGLAHDNITDEFIQFTNTIDTLEYGPDIDTE